MQHGGVAPGLPPEAIAANLASPYKTRLCRHFLQSAKCAYGASCNFAHGEAELRVRSHSSYAAQASYAPQMYAPQAYAAQPQAYAPQPYAVQPQAYAPQARTLIRART